MDTVEVPKSVVLDAHVHLKERSERLVIEEGMDGDAGHVEWLADELKRALQTDTPRE